MKTPVYIKDDFLFFNNKVSVDSFLGDSFLIETNRVSESVNYINKHKIKCLTINSLDYRSTDLSFLKDIPLIEKIVVLHKKIDPSMLVYLKNLKEMRLNQITKPLDFNNFPNLQILGTDYDNKRFLNLNSCKKLFWVWLNSYNEENLQAISGLEGLKYLTFYKPKMSNLSGIEKFLSLAEIKIDTAKNLSSLDGLSEKNNHLKLIDIFNAPNLTNYQALNKLTTLEKIYFARTGETENIDFIEFQRDLKLAVIGMKVTDGNVKCLLNVPEAQMLDFPNNNISSKDLKPIKRPQ